MKWYLTDFVKELYTIYQSKNMKIAPIYMKIYNFAPNKGIR